MKIAVLNFPFDNNYGGNLQRYALMKVLSDLGHSPCHLYTRFAWRVPGKYPMFTIAKRAIKKVLCMQTLSLKYEKRLQLDYEKSNGKILPFYNKYVCHTPPIEADQDFEQYDYFDAYIVGSDQVWRKSYNGFLPYSSMFLDFVKKEGVKRIAYGVSFGKKENELTKDDIRQLSPLYSKFDAVSVRELSGLDLLKEYGWTKPEAVYVLDPTLLLQREDYLKLIENGDTQPSAGDAFCYILDNQDAYNEIVDDVCAENGLTSFRCSLSYQEQFSVEQWLRSFLDSKMIITDSYHGFVFSIIFNKPVKLLINHKRGNDRFHSLMKVLDIVETDDIDWGRVNARVSEMRQYSFDYLIRALQ